MVKKWTESEVLSLASKIEFFVHKYSHKHGPLRKLTRRICKDKKLIKTMTCNRFFYYRTNKEI